MATRTAFLVRLLRVFPTWLQILLCAICVVSLAEAQHGGGGGHSGGGHSTGGHFSSGHSSGSYVGAHFGWLHFRFGKHSGREAELEESSSFDTSTHLPSHLWNSDTLVRGASIRRMPPTLLWSPPLLRASPNDRVSIVSSRMRRHPRFFFHRFPRFSSSGCFFNGLSQICFFEPFWPLLCFSDDFDPFYFRLGFGGGSPDVADESGGLTQSEMSAMSQAVNPSDDDTGEGNSQTRFGDEHGKATEDWDLDKGLFVLVLNNGSSHPVRDYWAADGYLEYISPDGTRSHIPLGALDLTGTVVRNEARGLPFVLRSTPAENR